MAPIRVFAKRTERKTTFGPSVSYPVLMFDRVDEAKLRGRVVRAFARRARSTGIRAVSMASLARDLGISTKTLYRAFDSKEQLVEAAVATWVQRLLAQLDAPTLPADPVRALLHSSEVWEEQSRRFAPPFWEDLQREYPAAYATVLDARRRYRAAVRERAQGYLRDELPAELALELLDVLLGSVLDNASSAGRDEVRKRLLVALDVWAHGALKGAVPTA